MRSLLVQGVAGRQGPQRLLGQRQHKYILVLGRAHHVVPQLLVFVFACVGAKRIESRDVGCRVLVVEKPLCRTGNTSAEATQHPCRHPISDAAATLKRWQGPAKP